METKKVRERPILFSTPMVQAVDEGLKDVTRRITGGLKKINESPDDWELHGSNSGETGMVFNHPKQGDWSVCFRNKKTGEIKYVKSPYGGDGDVLYLRETLYQEGELGLKYVADNEHIDESIIPDDYGPYGGDYSFRAIPNIHMPKWACRLKLEILSIGVERLQDITEEDAIDEGIRYNCPSCGYSHVDQMIHGDHHLCKTPMPKATEVFRTLWTSINGPDSWEASPWVWRIEFRKLIPPHP